MTSLKDSTSVANLCKVLALNCPAMVLMESLHKFLNIFREQFEKYELEGMELTSCDTLTLDKRRARRATRPFDDDREENASGSMSAATNSNWTLFSPLLTNSVLHWNRVLMRTVKFINLLDS